MMKSRIVMSAVLTAGLGLSGLVAASSSGAATPQQAKAAGAHAGDLSAKKASPAASRHGSRLVVCFVGKKPGGGVPGLPGLPEGKATKVVTTKGKPAGTVVEKSGKVTITVKDGKAYVNGRPVPLGKLTSGCPDKLPGAHPGAPGKNGKAVFDGGSGLTSAGAPSGHEAGLTAGRLDG